MRNLSRSEWGFVLVLSILIFLLLSVLDCIKPAVSVAEEQDCLMCHEQLSKGKVVHSAVQMGCPTCHSAIDASDVPHKKTNDVAKGLSANQPDLCYNCHDRSMFTKKTVHAAVGMGCTMCHSPHSSENDGLLLSATPDLCYNCHDNSGFTGETVHPPVTAGMCASCHNPHSSETGKLLLSEPPELCYTCHDKTAFINKRKPHVPVEAGMCITCHEYHASDNISLLAKTVTGLCTSCHKGQASGKHALGGLRGTHPVQNVPDPSREGKEMSCASCHDPHGSDHSKLFVEVPICKKCHKF